MIAVGPVPTQVDKQRVIRTRGAQEVAYFGPDLGLVQPAAVWNLNGVTPPFQGHRDIGQIVSDEGKVFDVGVVVLGYTQQQCSEPTHSPASVAEDQRDGRLGADLGSA